MAATGTPTPNIGLKRPLGTDPASVDDINYNSNLIDTKLGPVGNTSVQAQINELNSNLTYNAGSSVNFQQVFVGKGTNAKDGYFGNIILDKPVHSGTTVKLKADFTQYGTWYSDNASHTLDNTADITAATVNGNTVWFTIPASNVTTANSIAWIRLQGIIEIS